MSLHVPADDIPYGSFDTKTAAFRTSLVHGTSLSLMLAERPGGYHSYPHTHDCEQLNLLLSGEVHVFCGGAAFLLRAGDVMRVPPNTVHWSWNRADEPCVAIEVHAPGLQNDPQTQAYARALFDDGEPTEAPGPVNVMVDLPAEEIARIEALSPAPAPSEPR